MTKTCRAGTAGLLLALAAAATAPPAPAVTVTLRVEGSSTTLVRQVEVTPSAAVTVDKTGSGGGTCDGDTYGGALELATGGDWSGPVFSGFGQAVDTIKGEAHAFRSGAFWGFDVNNSPVGFGLCDTGHRPAQGDEVLLYAACEAAPQPTCFSGDPLEVTGPSTAAPGVPFTVRVDEYTSPFGQAPAKAPSAGAAVAGGGVTANTGADGTASVTLGGRGPVELVATKGGRVRDELAVCVTDGADGFCGTAPPGAPAPTPGGAVPCATTGDDGLCGTRDRLAPQARIRGIAERQVFRRGRGPRALTATVADDPSGLYAVKLGLSRRYRGRCSVLSGRRAAFRRARCGSHPVFRVGDRPDVSYLLPRRLGPGRYVLDVIAIDKALNRDRLARGRSRVAFTVR